MVPLSFQDLRSAASQWRLPAPPTALGLSRERLRRSWMSVLQPLDQEVTRSGRLRRRPGLAFLSQGQAYELPVYEFAGAPGGGDPIHIGVFAGIHGDEPESCLGLVTFLLDLAAAPGAAEGFVIHAYPVCNPTGLEDGSRTARSGRDLNREFGRRSADPEVRLLEEEIRERRFHGLVSLHCDDTSHGLYGFLSGRHTGDVLSVHLLKPALAAAERHLPRNRNAVIDGFAAQESVLATCYEGVLGAPPSQADPPFEITFETPQGAPAGLQAAAFSAALLSILAEYRRLTAHAANL